MSKQNIRWHWMFHYKLNREIIPSDWSLSPKLKLITNHIGNIIGFDVEIDTPNNNSPEADSNNIAMTIVQILTGKSEQVVTYLLLGSGGKPNNPNLSGVLTSSNKHIYNIEGAALKIDHVNLTDTNIKDIITSGAKHNSLQHLNNAISHFCSGTYKDCINEAFMVIEKKRSLHNYDKYECIRNIVSHKEDQPRLPKTVCRFDKYFKKSDFEFEVPHVKSSPILVIDFESSRTIQTLKNISHEAKHSLNF
jgi:hypothetical protein